MNNDAFFSGNHIPPMPFFSDDFNLNDIVDQSLSFDHVVDMIRGEAPNPLSITANDHNLYPQIFTSNVQENQEFNQLLCPTELGDVFSNFNSPRISSTNTSLLNSLSGIEDDMVNEDDEAEDNSVEAEQSSGKSTAKKGKVDRSRTLVSERKRRGRMKEKLYALRALVPNITKMDKASIVGDAVLYLQDLQIQANKLKSQIQDLESSYETVARCQALVDTPKKNISPLQIPVCKIIMQVEVIQIEDKEFYVKIVSNKGQGIASCLYRALDTLRNFIIKCSNLTSLCDQFVFTFTINVGKSMNDFNLPDIRLWISGAFMNQGFECQTF